MIFFAGSYTIKDSSPAPNPTGKGIGRFEFDHLKGRIEHVDYTWQRSPSFLLVSENKKYLYAAEECKQSLSPKILSYKIGENGTLSLINSQRIKGGFACHMCEVNNQIIVANYMTGNAMVFPLMSDGSLAPSIQTIQHYGSGINKERQAGPHMHMIYPENEKRIFIVDLGLDKALAYQEDKEETWRKIPEKDISLCPGSGARHMVMNHDRSNAYILGELSGTIEVFENTANGFKSIQCISFLKENYQGRISGASIRLHPNGKFIYASERDSGTISVLRVDENSGRLTYVKSEGAKGETPRDINIDPEGEWLFAANQDSDQIVAFRINKNGTVKYVSHQSVGTPTCIAFL